MSINPTKKEKFVKRREKRDPKKVNMVFDSVTRTGSEYFYELVVVVIRTKQISLTLKRESTNSLYADHPEWQLTITQETVTSCKQLKGDINRPMEE